MNRMEMEAALLSKIEQAEHSLQKIAEQLIIEGGKLRSLLSRCQEHLEDGDEGDNLYEEINRALARLEEYSVPK